MKDIKYYTCLPEAIEQELIESETKELFENQKNLDASLIFEALHELSERQVINYSKIDEKIKKDITNFFISAWNRNSIDNTNICIAIMINFGIQEFYDFLKKETENITDQKILAELLEVFSEFGENIEDVSFKF